MSVLEFVISLCKNDVATTGQNKLQVYYPPQTDKCPHLYHCLEILFMTKVTNCPHNVYSWAEKSKMLLCIWVL